MTNLIFNKKKILITGDRGFKGSWLTLWLLNLGAKVYGISLKEPDQLHYNFLNMDYPSYELDIRDKENLKKQIKKINPDLIFHLAAQSLVNNSYKNPIDTWNTNVMGTAFLLDSIKSLNNLSGILVVTSDKCYENLEKNIFYKEGDRLGGYDPYSASKAACDILATSFYKSFLSNNDIQLATVRAGNVIGGGDFSKDRLIPDIYKAVKNKRILDIRYPSSIRPWQHVLDCLHGYLLLAERIINGEKKFSRAWNFGPTKKSSKTVISVVEEFNKYFPELQVNISEIKNHESSILQLDSSDARKYLNWVPILDFKDCISYTSLWYKEFITSQKIISLDQIVKYELKKGISI
jgi:CDP-glucose 4,6-dehydratase